MRRVSVVVPAYDEAPNIRPLTERLFAATRAANLDAELLIVDDESRGSAETKAVVDTLVSQGFCVRLHTRRRVEGRGLSSAVLLGFQKATHDVLLCMDADLQHEPESVPDIAAPVFSGAADFSVGSRNIGGGKLGFDWSPARRIISAGATILAWPLTSASDPMSGFFCLTKETLARGADAGINATGFKIGLELMVRCNCRRVVDVPITFRERVAGESKLNAKQQALYLKQLSGLFIFKFGALPMALVLLAMVAIMAFVLYHLALTLVMRG